jgi:hypothetical protein
MNDRNSDPFWRYFFVEAVGVVLFLLMVSAIGYVLLFGDSA